MVKLGGCPECARASCGQYKILSTQDFVQRAKTVHGDRYDYSATEYQNYRQRLQINCPRHGEFSQYPSIHLGGSGCQRCNPTYHYSERFFGQIPERKDIPGQFYCLKFQRDGFQCYKVGITATNGRIKQHLRDPSYKVSVIKVQIMPLYQAWKKEQQFLKFVRNSGLSVRPPVRLKWGGSTECFMPKGVLNAW